jgi:predicted PolB exonuclease-like 3'-5' exonuclease
MSDQSAIVWDLETVPDLAAAARMLDLSNATDAEVRENCAKSGYACRA